MSVSQALLTCIQQFLARTWQPAPPTLIVLPDDIMILVFDHLPISDLKNARLVSRKWHDCIPPAALYNGLTFARSKTSLDSLQGILTRFPFALKEITVALDFNFLAKKHNQQHPAFSRYASLPECLHSLHTLESLRLLLDHDLERTQGVAVNICKVRVGEFLQSLKGLKKVLMKQVKLDRLMHHFLTDYFGRDPFPWPRLESLTLIGFSIPGWPDFCTFLAPFKLSLREVHIHVCWIGPRYSSCPPGSLWSPFFEGLRDEYSLTSFSIRDIYEDLEDSEIICNCDDEQYHEHLGDAEVPDEVAKQLIEYVLGGDIDPIELWRAERIRKTGRTSSEGLNL